VLERGSDVVLAAHRTRVHGITVVTSRRSSSRLVRGPGGAYVVERFELREGEPATTALSYEGELGSDVLVAGAMIGGACRSDLDRGCRSELREDLRTGRRSVAALRPQDVSTAETQQGPVVTEAARARPEDRSEAMTWPRTFAPAVSSSPGRSL
jgi:hypothetical protein